MKLDDDSVPASLWDTVVGDDFSCDSLEEAAQRFVDGFYERYTESIVLVRVFGTVSYARLPAAEQRCARDFATALGSPQELAPETDVLTLFATRGAQAEWNAREDSIGHRAIPLISSDFITEIPMIARLLGETGLVSLPAGGPRSQYVTRGTSDNESLFFVGDARLTTDERGRLIIPAVDFVSHHAIKTVFGFGGRYGPGAMFVTTVVFCRDPILRATAAQYLPLGRAFKSETDRLVRGDALFR